jgi:leader peptidase (prepilin peptidase)/N-methyltransferase
MIRILGTVFAGLLGLAFGSFLNVCLSRWPKGESIVHPRSHCCRCGHVLAWWENVPLVSWLTLRGRCRECRTWIGVRYPLVELAVGVLWATVVWRSGLDVLAVAPDFPRAVLSGSFLATIAWMTFYWLVIALAVLDVEHLWLPDRLTLPGAAAGFLFSVFGFRIAGILGGTGHGHDGFWSMPGGPWEMGLYRLLAILATAGLVLLIRWVYWLVRRREGLGLGDAKLMAMLAAWLGLPGALLSFAIGIVLGALLAMVWLVVPPLRGQSERWAASKLPLGTFLCIGGIVSGLWGPQIIAVYLRWCGF